MAPVNACDISINQLLRYAISQQATSIVIAHNHPLGRPSPSKADLALTQSDSTGLPASGYPSD